MELQKDTRTFPWDIEATRFTIARLVLEHGGYERNPAQINREVLSDLEQIGNLIVKFLRARPLQPKRG